jgi:amidase
MQVITAERSGAFIEQFSLPPTGSGPLTGLQFAVKDIIDVAGHRTGCGNPDWLATHPPAQVSAVCVEQLLSGGAQCTGKTISDELANSMLGENFFYGTPLNAAAPDRVPGGSSCGSASTVACGLVDFALGTDTGGSVRVPASNCGLWGMRPTHGIVSVAGVMPYSPTFDSVGVLARTSEVLQLAMGFLLGVEPLRITDKPTSIHLVSDAFALADPEVEAALQGTVEQLREMFGDIVRQSSFGELLKSPPAADLSAWLSVFNVLRSAEVNSCLGAWVAATSPKFGPAAGAGFEAFRRMDRTQVGKAICRRESLCQLLQRAIGPRDLLCLPTAPTVAPVKGTASHDRQGNYYSRALSLTSIAGVGRLPQISLPLADVSGVPIGLSLIAARGEDMWLLQAAQAIASGTTR